MESGSYTPAQIGITHFISYSILMIRGRGNLFLRHIERVGCIAYVLDLSGGQQEGQHPLLALPPAQQLAVLQVRIRALNPMDASIGAGLVVTIYAVLRRSCCQSMPLSCLFHKNAGYCLEVKTAAASCLHARIAQQEWACTGDMNHEIGVICKAVSVVRSALYTGGAG